MECGAWGEGTCHQNAGWKHSLGSGPDVTRCQHSWPQPLGRRYARTTHPHSKQLLLDAKLVGRGLNVVVNVLWTAHMGAVLLHR